MRETLGWIQPFLKAIASGATFSEAASEAGITSGTAYARKRTDPDFAEAYKDALEDGTDVLESAARYRAVHGHEEPVVYQGQFTPIFEYDHEGKVLLDENKQPVQARGPDGSLKWLTVRKPSDTLLALLLKGRRKEFATDRTELTGLNGGPVAVDSTTRAARISALLATAKDRSDIA